MYNTYTYKQPAHPLQLLRRDRLAPRHRQHLRPRPWTHIDPSVPALPLSPWQELGHTDCRLHFTRCSPPRGRRCCSRPPPAVSSWSAQSRTGNEACVGPLMPCCRLGSQLVLVDSVWKERFYAKLVIWTSVTNSCPRRVIPIALGDSSAVTGCDRAGCEMSFGPHGYGSWYRKWE